jgi:SAM-dependent methyltransferase
LVAEWQLSPYEVDYVNRQQGFCCTACGNNLRSLALAGAILTTYNFTGTLAQFVESDIGRTLKVLEVNEAGGLSPTLKRMPNHQLVSYPEYDMTNLSFESDSFDLVIHSDTLEHVPNPERGLSECRRVLRSVGKCIFTVPIIVDRMTRSRTGLAPSYHGQSGVPADDQVVCTEFGADVWKAVLKAGFNSCEIFSFEYPAALAIIARK